MARTGKKPSATPAPAPAVPLGSLTQPGGRAAAVTCRWCGSDRVTRIAMSLTDGSPVEFTSCHACEKRSWTEAGPVAGAGTEISVSSVLDRTRRRT